MSWLVAFLIVGIGGVLAFKRSSWLVDYMVVVHVFNRGLRRLLDWEAGAFDRLSPISLSPLLVGGLMLLPFLQRFHFLPKPHKTICGCLLAALAYSFVIGFFRVQLAAVYALAEALTPVAVLGYILTSDNSQNVKDRWIRSVSWCAILASLYGWFQYLTIPPWDAFWVTEVGFIGYLGILEPTKMTVFSTMAERGILASFLAFAVVPMIISPKWRTVCSWAGVILVFSVILLTLSRGGIIIATMSVFIYLLVNRGANKGPIIAGMVILMAAAWFGLGRLPGAERITTRFESLGNMKEDGSFKGRSELTSLGLSQTLSNPIGYGMGATGIAGRINTGSLEGQAASVDAGYFDIMATYGFLGGGLFFYAMWRIWKQLALYYRAGYRPEQVMLARAFMIALIPATMAGNFLNGFSLLWVVFGSALCPWSFQRFQRKRVAGRANETN